MSDAYREAGVDTEAGEKAVALIQSLTSDALTGIGGFAGLIDVSFLKDYKEPLLATGTDGVGTKIEIAKALNNHSTIGIDLVAMIANDIVTTAAKPLFMTDYIACGKVEPNRIKDIVSGILQGCELAGMKLLGGETAEHPGVMNDEDYDLAGAAVGVVEKENVLGAHNVKPGDVLVAMPSSGVHSNGFSLVRKIIKDSSLDLHQTYDSLSDTLGNTLLTPTVMYVKTCLEMMNTHNVHAFAHITGGGIAANVARVIPENLTAVIDRSTWTLPTIFSFLQTTGNIDRASMEKTFNQGIGMIAVIDRQSAESLPDGMWVCGEVRERKDADVSDSAAKGGIGGVVMLKGD